MSESSPKTYKVVVTGFGPFQGVPVNESWRAVSGLWDEKLPSQIKLVTRELPVVYDIVRKEVDTLWNEEKPDLIIHVGVSKQDHRISVERRSFNLDYSYEDIHNKCPEDKCCVRHAPEIITTGLDVDNLCETSNQILKNHNMKAFCGPSVDPGRYLCGFTYFLSLNQDPKKSLFVHVPSEETFSIKEMTTGIKSIIIQALNQLYNANLQLN